MTLPLDSSRRPDEAAPLLPGVAPLAERYDCFLLDLWGVIHDGVRPLPGALRSLEELRRREKRIALVSNAPRRAAVITEAMEKMGIGRALYDVIHCSGEDVYSHLKDRHRSGDPFYEALSGRCFFLGPKRDHNLLDGLDLVLAAHADDAGFMLVTGPFDDDDPVEKYDPLLVGMAARQVPMICANADREVIRGSQRIVCAGAIADRYRELGGVARYHGKPDPALFRHSLSLLESKGESRTVVVGDGLQTDMVGAREAGLDAVFVLSGIHGAAVLAEGDPDEGEIDQTRLAALLRKAEVVPVGILRRFSWSD